MASPLIMNGVLNVPPIYFFYRYLAHPNCSSGFVLETMQVDFLFAISKFRNWYNYFYRESNFEFENVKLIFKDDAVLEIARRAISKKTGARWV